MDARQQARDLAREYLHRGSFLDWFEILYASAGDNPEVVPWADGRPNPHLVEWITEAGPPAPGSRAVVVGCGLGDDAEFLAARGLAVTAFDLAPSAVRWCRRRFPDTRVDYLVADLLNPPVHWHRRFDLVFEAYTLQSLPPDMLGRAVTAVVGLLAPRGRLLVVTRGRDESEPADGPPWPLTRAALRAFIEEGLAEVGFQDDLDGREDPPVRRFRALYERRGDL